MKKSKDESGQRSRFHFYTTPFGQIFIVCWLGFVGLIIRNFVFLSQKKDIPIYYLRITDQNLVFGELPRSGTQDSRRSVLVARPRLGFKYELSEGKGISRTVVSLGGKRYVHDGNGIIGTVFAPKSNSFYFADVAWGKPDKSQVWRWNEKDGFSKLGEFSGALMELALSPNEDALCSSNYDADREPRMKLVTFSLSDKRSTESQMETGSRLCAVLDKSNILVKEYHYEFIQRNEENVYRINLTTGTHDKFLPELNVCDVVVFNGSLWCLCEKEGKYSAVRVNSTNDKVEEAIDLSKYVDRPWPKIKSSSSEPEPGG